MLQVKIQALKQQDIRLKAKKNKWKINTFLSFHNPFPCCLFLLLISITHVWKVHWNRGKITWKWITQQMSKHWKVIYIYFKLWAIFLYLNFLLENCQLIFGTCYLSFGVCFFLLLFRRAYMCYNTSKKLCQTTMTINFEPGAENSWNFRSLTISNFSFLNWYSKYIRVAEVCKRHACERQPLTTFASEHRQRNCVVTVNALIILTEWHCSIKHEMRILLMIWLHRNL